METYRLYKVYICDEDPTTQRDIERALNEVAQYPVTVEGFERVTE